MFASLLRASPRLLFLLFVAMWLWVASLLVGPPMPPELAPILFVSALSILGIALGDATLRILQPQVDAGRAAQDAIANKNLPAAVVYLARSLLACVVLLLFVTSSRAAQPPAAALPYLPILKAEQLAHWPDMPLPPALGAQVEQETCITLKHRKCWNPRAELRTSREQGIGLGQLTRTWRKDGSQRFDALTELRERHRDALAGLSWVNPYDPQLQLRAVVLKGLDDYRAVRGAADDFERLAMSKAAYNGGIGGLASDRRMCAATAGCDPTRWFGHVERTSLKAKRALPGYGQSAFEINRGYVRNVLLVRIVRYQVLADINPIWLAPDKNRRQIA